MPPRTERRRAARVTPPAASRLRIPGLLDAAEVRDLSSSGVCCTTSRPLPMLTQVQLVLLLPDEDSTREVVCAGAVVRCVRDGTRTGEVEPDAEPPRGATWETAIFFTG